MSLYDPGPLIALSSLGTTGFRRPYITPPRLPELRVLAAEVLMVGLSMNRGHALPNSNLPSTVFQTFGCLRTSGSNAGWGRWSQHYFLLISSNDVPSSDRTPGWPSCVCVFVRRLCLHTTAVHTVPVSTHKLPPRRFFFFFRPHQRPGVRAQGQQLSFYSWITSRNVTLTTFMRYARRAVHSLIPPLSYVRMKDEWQWHILQICQGPSSRYFHRIDRRHQIIRATADRRLELSQPGNRWMLSKHYRIKMRST